MASISRVSLNQNFHLNALERQIEDHKKAIDKNGNGGNVDISKVIGLQDAIARHSGSVSNVTARGALQEQEELSLDKEDTHKNKWKLGFELCAAACSVIGGIAGMSGAGFGIYAKGLEKGAKIGVLPLIGLPLTYKQGAELLSKGGILADSLSQAATRGSSIIQSGSDAKQTKLGHLDEKSKLISNSQFESQRSYQSKIDAMQQMLRAHFEARSQQVTAIARLSAGG